MKLKNATVRELNETDVESITNYWLHASPEYLEAMGVDLNKMPGRDEWHCFISEQLSQNYPDKNSYCIVWEVDGKAIGHSNTNKIIYGEEAYMHLHIWDKENRNKGYGANFVTLTIPYFFKNLKLKKLYCEPFALNPSPNKILEKVGFQLVKEYVTIPGWLNFEQPVKLWEMSLMK
ncbi:MAG: GNAT family N-acetyltransferase [Bacteroidia bacterium]